MLNFIAHLERFNKLAGTLGPTWTCSNSIIQRCSLSLLATVALSTVWARVLEEEVPAVLCNSIEDYRRLCATGKEAPKHLQSAIQITRDFDGATETRFNPMKSTCATPTKQMEKEMQQTAEQFGMKIVSFEQQVGYPVPTKATETGQIRTRGTRTVARIARPPKSFGFEARARLIETNALPRYQFAIECGMPSEQSQGALTSQIMRTLALTDVDAERRDKPLNSHDESETNTNALCSRRLGQRQGFTRDDMGGRCIQVLRDAWRECKRRASRLLWMACELARFHT